MKTMSYIACGLLLAGGLLLVMPVYGQSSNSPTNPNGRTTMNSSTGETTSNAVSRPAQSQNTNPAIYSGSTGSPNQGNGAQSRKAGAQKKHAQTGKASGKIGNAAQGSASGSAASSNTDQGTKPNPQQ